MGCAGVLGPRLRSAPNPYPGGAKSRHRAGEAARVGRMETRRPVPCIAPRSPAAAAAAVAVPNSLPGALREDSGL